MMTPPPAPPSFPCRNCGTPLPFGAKVCLRCGASTDFVPAAERTNNTAATLLGVGTTIGLLVVVPGIGVLLSGASRLGNVTNAQGDLSLFLALLQIVLFLLLVVASAVLVARNPRQSPKRAFGFAALITIAVLFGCGIVALAALFFLCIGAFQHLH